MLSLVSAVRDLGRLREIAAVLARHGFSEVVARAGLLSRGSGESAEPVAAIPEDEARRGDEERKTVPRAVRVRLVLQDLGPSFIKLGQIASTRQDLLPPDVIAELKKLQDDVPPVPFDLVRTQVEASLGAPLADLFVRFDERPLAAASIGQVHRAVLATDDGPRDVVVKVQRPGVEATVSRDVDLLHRIAAAVERAIPETRIYSPTQLVQQFDRSITAELNYLVEAENAERFARNFAGHPGVKFPTPYRQASSKQVLTLEFLDGRKIDAALAAGAEGKHLARAALGVVIQMIFSDGFFHADPHPGNILVLGPIEAPIIGLIDLGMVGRLSPELRDRTVDLMIAAARQDGAAVADALYAIGRPTRKVDLREYRAEVSLLAEKYLGRPLREIELSALVRDLVQGAMKYGIEVPADFMLVGKAMMTIEGIGKQLDPDLDVLSVATPQFEAIVKERYSPERLGGDLLRGVERLSRAGYDIPMHAREVLDDLRQGRLQLVAADPERTRTLERLGRRLSTAAVTASLVIGGSLLLSSGNHPVIGGLLLATAALSFLAGLLRPGT